MTARLIGLVAALALLEGVANAGSMNGRAGTMPAFYDDTLFTINFKELPPGGETATLAQNGSINIIYMCDACEGALPGGQSFVSVIDAIQGDAFNPLWPEVPITLDTIAPQQFTSDEDIREPADAGEITAMPTGQVVCCSGVC